MDAKTAEDPKLLAHYEGLVRKTAARVEPIVEEDYEDICQFLRVKVWKALQAFTSKRVKPTQNMTLIEKRDRFVFACLTNAVKDVLKKKRHHLLFIEDITKETTWNGTPNESFGSSPGAAHKFEAQYFSEEDAFALLFEEDAPLIPSTLDAIERRVALLLYLDFKPTEIATQIKRPRKDVATIVESIQGKMADWRPTAGEPEPVRLAA
jgi:DNA-directed RNA polymerase specialized sigma24 family protein